MTRTRPRFEKRMRREEVTRNLSKIADRLEREADLADRAVKEEVAAVAAVSEELARLRANLKMRTEAAAIARREAVLARSAAGCRKLSEARVRPPSPCNFFVREMFANKNRDTENKCSANMSLQRWSKMWMQLSEAQKKPYREMFAKEMKEYKAWEHSKEGQTVLMRQRLLRQMHTRASMFPGSVRRGSSRFVPPAKSARTSEKNSAPPRTRSRGRWPAYTGPSIEGEVFEEACKASMGGQMLDLCGCREIQELKKSSEELFHVLQECSGKVDDAKKQLLSEAT